TTPPSVTPSCAITLISFHDFLLRMVLRAALPCAVAPPHERMTTVNADMQKNILLISSPPSKTKSQEQPRPGARMAKQVTTRRDRRRDLESNQPPVEAASGPSRPCCSNLW